VLETLALVVWNVGSRSPIGVVRDARKALMKPQAIVAGLLALVVGLIFVAAATVLLLPAVPNPQVYFAPVQICTLLIALAIEFLIGADLRRIAGGRTRRTP
jgi:hypothetical protein